MPDKSSLDSSASTELSDAALDGITGGTHDVGSTAPNIFSSGPGGPKGVQSSSTVDSGSSSLTGKPHGGDPLFPGTK